MNRREVIQRIALLLGGAVSAPALLDVLAAHAQGPAATWHPAVLNADELALVSRLVDILLPRTDTPGALDVGVPAFIDSLLKEVSSAASRERYLKQLHEFDAAAQTKFGKPFVRMDAAQQIAWVSSQQEAAIAAERAATAQEQKLLRDQVQSGVVLPQRTESTDEGTPRSFILKTKELALLGFFTSKPGATEVLQYIAIPGAYHGCIPVNQAGNGKRWAT